MESPNSFTFFSRAWLRFATGLMAAILVIAIAWYAWPRQRPLADLPEPLTAAPAESKVSGRFAKLSASYVEDTQRWLAATQAARTDAERSAVKRVDDASYSQRLWELVQEAPDDPAALEICAFLVTQFSRSLEVNLAFERLNHFMDDPRLEGHCRTLAYSMAAQMEPYLRSVHKNHSVDTVRLHAGLALAHYLRWQVLERHARTRIDGQVNHLEFLGTEEELGLIEEVETICRKLQEEQSNTPCQDEDDDGNQVASTMGKVAKTLLDSMEAIDIRRLAVGQTAPEIDAIDSTGKPLKLSAFRGKVVLISFGGQYCVPCKAMIPHERDLLVQMKDRPFALMGIDRSESSELAQLQAFLKREGVNWPVCPGRSASGQDLFRTWKVHAIPVLYLIDDQGAIRQRFDGYTEPKVLNEAVERLVKEAEQRRRSL